MDASGAVQVAAAVVGSLGTPVAVWLSTQAWRRERTHARIQEQARRRQQPQRVVVRTEEAEWPRSDGDGTYRTRVATVVNASDDPVFDLTVFWHEGEELTDFCDGRVALLPGETWSVPQPMVLAHSPSCDQVFASIWFSDVEERGWRRGPRGDLSSIRESLASP